MARCRSFGKYCRSLVSFLTLMIEGSHSTSHSKASQSFLCISFPLIKLSHYQELLTSIPLSCLSLSLWPSLTAHPLPHTLFSPISAQPCPKSRLLRLNHPLYGDTYPVCSQFLEKWVRSLALTRTQQESACVPSPSLEFSE